MLQDKEYKVLARKYRPKKFKNLIGQDFLIKIIINAIKNNRIAHAYILTGVRGVGKTTTARLIAMSINCKDRDKDSCEPCGQCDSCNSTGVDTNLDVIEMDAASNTGVDDVREIIENVKYKPVISDYKIFIIDEVHMLSKSAFNALLKTLEEPPEHVKFIFATTEVKKIPITVLSRCQRFDLHRIENKLLSEYLLKISNIENIEIDKEAISLIVRAADGSIRDGLSLLDQAITNQNTKIDSLAVINMLGLAEREKIFDLLEEILNGETANALMTYKKIYDLGADVIMIFDELLNVVHFLTQIKIATNLKDDIFTPEIERSRGDEISSKITLNNLNIIWQILFKGYQELQSGIHLFQHGEMIILRLIYLFDGSSPDDLLNKLTFKDKKNDSDKVNNNIKHEDIEKQKTINLKENLNIQKNKSEKNYISIDSYRKFVELFYQKREGLLHTQLYNDVTLVSFKEGEIILNTDKITDKSFIRVVAKHISKWTGRIWKINESTSNIGSSLHDEDVISQQKEIENMKNDNDIKKILKEFPESKIHSITDLTEVNNKEEITNFKTTKEN